MGFIELIAQTTEPRSTEVFLDIDEDTGDLLFIYCYLPGSAKCPRIERQINTQYKKTHGDLHASR